MPTTPAIVIAMKYKTRTMIRPNFDSTMGPTFIPQHFSIIDLFLRAYTMALASPERNDDPATEILSSYRLSLLAT